MEKQEEQKIKIFETVDKKESLIGDWRLTLNLSGGIANFTAKLIGPYIDAKTGKTRNIYNEHGVIQPGYMLQKPIMTFSPRTNRQDAHVVDFLLGHPEIFVEEGHGNLDNSYLRGKHSNPSLRLVNLDHQNIDELEDEDVIDKLVGRIVLDSGNQSLSLSKLKWILAALNMTYREDKYLLDKKAEKPKLRKRLKDYVRAKIENAVAVNNILDRLDEARYVYQIKELLRLDIITNVGGHIKYEGHPLGLNTESVVKYFKDNPDFYGELMSKLSKTHKLENA